MCRLMDGISYIYIFNLMAKRGKRAEEEEGPKLFVFSRQGEKEGGEEKSQLL